MTRLALRFCYRHHGPLLTRKKPMPGTAELRTGCSRSKRPKSIKFYRILQKPEARHCRSLHFGRDDKGREAAQVGVVAGWERLKSCPDQNQVATQTFLVPCMNRRLTTKFVLL